MKNPGNRPGHLISLTLALVGLMSLGIILGHFRSRPVLPSFPSDINSSKPAGQPPRATPSETAQSAKLRLEEAYGKLPLSFEANSGQTDSRVKCRSYPTGYGGPPSPAQGAGEAMGTVGGR